MTLKVKSFRTYLLAMVLAFVTAVTAWSPTGAAETADFNPLNASQIVAQMGAGWNLGNQLEANINGTPSETAWGNPVVTQALIQKVKAAGFKTIRIPVSYLNQIGSAPNYTINAAWLNRVKTVVDYAYNEGLNVIINIHGDGYNSVAGSWLLVNSGDQTSIRAKYQKVWQQIASTFASYDERLIFESMNEVFDGTYGTPNSAYYSNLNAYNQIFVDTVRQTGGNNNARWLLIPGWNTNIDYTVGNYGFVMPTDHYRSSSIPSSEKRIMISVHYYSPWDFAGEESGSITQWGATATNPSNKSTWGQEDYLESQLKSVYDKFVSQGYPAVIGEFGSIDKTAFDSANNMYRAAFAKAITAAAKKYGSVPVYWDNGHNGQYGFALFNRSTYAITQQGIIDAIMSAMGSSNPNPNPISGTYKIKNVATGLLIDGMGRTSNGSNAGQWSSSFSNNQRWIMESYGSYYKIKNVATNLYLDGMGRTSSGSICGQYSSGASNNQRWVLEAAGSNYRIKNVATGLYLDSGGSTTNGVDLKMWSSDPSTNLQWKLETP